MSFCEVASRMRISTRARPERGPRWKTATFGCGFFSLKTAIVLTWSAAVIGLSRATLRVTELPFSTSAGISSLTRPSRIAASPANSRIAASIVSGTAAPAGRIATTDRQPTAGMAAAAARRSRRLGLRRRGRFIVSALFPERRQVGDHVLDLLCGQHRLAAKVRGDPGEAVGPVIGRHDRGAVQAARVDDAQAQLALGRARAGAGEARREVALEALLRERAGMAEQAEADLAARDDRPPAGRVAGRPGEALWDRVVDDRERAQLRPRRVRTEHRGKAGGDRQAHAHGPTRRPRWR